MVTTPSVPFRAQPSCVDTRRRLTSPAVVIRSVRGHIVGLVARRRALLLPLTPTPKSNESWTTKTEPTSTALCGERLRRRRRDRATANENGLNENNDDDEVRGLRAEQALCLHCRVLYFVAVAIGGRYAPFCSLDCRASAALVEILQHETFDQGMTNDSWEVKATHSVCVGFGDDDESDQIVDESDDDEAANPSGA